MTFDPGVFYHLGFAVRDLDAAMARYAQLFGVAGWGVLADGPIPTQYRGEPSVVRARAAYGRAGGVYIELVQPVDGRSVPQAVLEEHGEGLYHLGYWVEDVRASMHDARAAGIDAEWVMDGDVPMFAYLARAADIGVHIELVNSSLRPYIEGLVERASVE